MSWIDSHCHLHYDGLYEKLDQILQECRAKDITKLLCVSVDTGDYQKINSFIAHDEIYQSIGIHPLNADKYSAQEITSYLNGTYPKVVAIGETGLDDFRAPLNQEQIDSFEIHVQHAVKHDLPIIMHTRSGNNSRVEAEAMRIVSNNPGVKGVAHCFGGSLEFAQFLIKSGWFISFAGNVTYKKATNLHEVAKMIPLKRILIETDSPFLSPEGYRGTLNDPTRVIEVAKALAQLKNIALSDIEKNTFQNFCDLFVKAV